MFKHYKCYNTLYSNSSIKLDLEQNFYNDILNYWQQNHAPQNSKDPILSIYIMIGAIQFFWRVWGHINAIEMSLFWRFKTSFLKICGFACASKIIFGIWNFPFSYLNILRRPFCRKIDLFGRQFLTQPYFGTSFVDSSLVYVGM